MNQDMTNKNTLEINWNVIDAESFFDEKIKLLNQKNFFNRFCQKDVSLWSENESEAEEIAHRLDWLEAPKTSTSVIDIGVKLLSELIDEGFTHAVVLGMGGSSLAPEVFSQFLKNDRTIQEKRIDITILDSTDPIQILQKSQNLETEKTVFIISSKSGTTAEVNSLFSFFWDKVQNVSKLTPGKHFIAISDPETPLIQLGKEMGFRKIIPANPNVGGRFSALIEFGLIPAILCGYKVEELLNIAAHYQVDGYKNAEKDNPGFLLGLILAEAYQRGKDKLTLLSQPGRSSFGAWIEQLVAESSGKSGKGMLPIDGEPVLKINKYSDDRIFVNFSDDDRYSGLVSELVEKDHLVIHFPLKRAHDLAAYFYIWEVAVAVMCSLIGVNAFDQPNVQLSKQITHDMLTRMLSGEDVLIDKPVVSNKKFDLFCKMTDISEKLGIQLVIKNFLLDASQNDFISINAFLPMTEKYIKSLTEIRKKISAKYLLPSTLGFGPRFLHSTGQLHKGGKNNGHFIIITQEKNQDIQIPGKDISFGDLQLAQAIGDMRALEQMHRRVLRIHLKQSQIDELISVF